MATKQATKQATKATVITELCVGPEPAGIRYCVMCRQPIQDGEHWRKVRRVGGFAVGIHDAHYLQGPAGEQ